MNKISIRSTLILSILGALSVACLIIVEMTKVEKEQEWHKEKQAASSLAFKAAKYLKGVNYGENEFLDNINDPNETGLIGEEFSSITTGQGSLPIKNSTTNPNCAAMIVQLLKDAGLQNGDNVGICMTGSLPGLNIATLSATQTLQLNPVIICSVTSSTWGATDPEFTWLDMHSELNKAGIISATPAAASIGGHDDAGRALSNEGRQKVLEAITRNNVNLINGQSLEDNIAERIKYFNNHPNGKPIALFINIGGGIASLGSDENGRAVPSGLNENLKLAEIPDKKGVIFEITKADVPVLHLLHLEKLIKKYDLPIDPVPLPPIGSGELFVSKRYNFPIVLSSALLITGLVLAVAWQDKKRNELGNEIIKDDQEMGL